MDYHLQLLVGFFLPSFLFLYYLRLCKPKIKSSLPSAPEAAGAWPIIGHLHLIGGDSVPHITLAKMADKYGPAFTVRLGMRRALVVSNWEVAKECFTVNDRTLATRPKSIAIKYLGYDYAIFGFSHYGPYWREVRKIVTLELLSNRRLEMFRHVRILEVQTSMKELYQMCAAKNKVDMTKWLGDLTLNIIVRMVAGNRYFVTDTGEKLVCQQGIRDCLYFLGVFIMSDALPFLEGLDVQGHERRMKKSAKNMDTILQRWLEDHRRERSSMSSSYKTRVEQDFMDVMISSMEETKISDYDADTVIKATCLNVILGGNDTTVVTLTWALSLLLNNRHVLKKAQDELDVHIGKDRNVEESDIHRLEYLQAIVKETLRLYPAAPLSGPHEATEECTIAGYRVPAGTRIVTNLWKIHRDPRVWSDPYEFQPERFLTSHAGFDVRGQNFEFIPFGSGRRMCPGVSFATQVVHLILARLLQGFELATPSDEPVDMTESSGLTNLKATPLEILLIPRLPSKLYQC